MHLHHSSVQQLHSYFYTHNFTQQSALKKTIFPAFLLFLIFEVCVPKVFPSAHNHEDVMLTTGDKGWGRERSTLRLWENNVIPGTRAFNEETNCTGDADKNPVL